MKFRIVKRQDGYYIIEYKRSLFWNPCIVPITGQTAKFSSLESAEMELENIVRRRKEAGVVKEYDERDILRNL